MRGLIFDRFGDFVGVRFESREGRMLTFLGREGQIGEIVRRVWAERILLEIVVDPEEPKWPVGIVMMESVGI